MTKEEPLIKQIVRSRALKTRDGSASPIRRTPKGGVVARSLSQPPLRVSRSEAALPAVYTLQILPYSLVYPRVLPTRQRISFVSTSQPDLSKLATPTPSRFTTPPSTTNVSRCTSPCSTMSRCASPMATISPLSISRAATPFSGNLIDANNNENFCHCPTRKGRQACFSSLCCEICRLFPNRDTANINDNQNAEHNYVHVEDNNNSRR